MTRENKGNSKIDLINDYVVIDIETTGLDPQYDEIIELGALKVKNGVVVGSFSKLIKPKNPISEFITQLTGISNTMVENAPSIEEELPNYLKFINEQNIVGHNVNFDINFIYDNSIEILNTPFQNDYIDTLRLSRRLYPNLDNHKLTTVCDYLKVSDNIHHRALSDCQLTFEIYEKIKNYVRTENIDLEILFKPKKHYKTKAADITASTDEFDESNLFYNKYCVFTGALSITRKEAMQKVVNLGGKCEDKVTKKTNYLILGNLDYQKCKGEKSSKYRKAEEYILAGQDIQIISENVFFDIIGENSIDDKINRLKYIDDCDDKSLDKIMSTLSINFLENKDFEHNEKLGQEYDAMASKIEKENIGKAIELYEKSLYYTDTDNHPYDRLAILYKKTSQENKIPKLYKFAMFCVYNFFYPGSSRNYRFLRFYEKYIDCIKDTKVRDF
ncbi:MAG: hypothetical protein KIG16_00520 [Eubacteriales bacterium]|nr:hypothetical protein [Eubacteriales bacterium]